MGGSWRMVYQDWNMGKFIQLLLSFGTIVSNFKLSVGWAIVTLNELLHWGKHKWTLTFYKERIFY